LSDFVAELTERNASYKNYDPKRRAPPRMIVTPLFDRTMFVLAAVALASNCGSSDDDVIPWCHHQTRSGALTIDGALSACPAITSFAVAPQRISTGEVANLRGTAVDLDSNNLSFSWAATAGTVADATLAETTYRCAGVGMVTLTFTVSDGTCQDDVDVEVDCVR
jgi:hypothetical protein